VLGQTDGVDWLSVGWVIRHAVRDDGVGSCPLEGKPGGDAVRHFTSLSWPLLDLVGLGCHYGSVELRYRAWGCVLSGAS
jgi:hypothetical protein